MNSMDSEQWPEDIEEMARRTAAAYRQDHVWHRIDLSRGSRPSRRPWWRIAAAVVVVLLLVLAHGTPKPSSSRFVGTVVATGGGPVTRFDGVPVEALSALLVTDNLPLSHPTAVYWGTVSRAGLKPLERFSTRFVAPSWPSVVRVVVVRAATSAGWVANSPGNRTIGGGYTTPGVGIGFFSPKGRLLMTFSAGGITEGRLRRMGWHLRRVFWPRDWAHRIWAAPWWWIPTLSDGGLSAYGPDASAAAAVLISVRTARHLVPLAGRTLFAGCPSDGPVWLVETPAGVTWMVDGTTGLLVGPVEVATGWFPLNHYGAPRPAPPMPLPPPLRSSVQGG
jgi:hypothetical protein